FQSDPDRQLIILTTAGAKGLNLTKAEFVVFYDIVFNPKLIEQIWGRAHRIGNESKSIGVIFLLIEGSVEERMWEIVETKTKVSDAVIEGKGELLKDDDFVDDQVDRSPSEELRLALGWTKERFEHGKELMKRSQAAGRAAKNVANPIDTA